MLAVIVNAKISVIEWDPLSNCLLLIMSDIVECVCDSNTKEISCNLQTIEAWKRWFREKLLRPRVQWSKRWKSWCFKAFKDMAGSIFQQGRIPNWDQGGYGWSTIGTSTKPTHELSFQKSPNFMKNKNLYSHLIKVKSFSSQKI